MTQTAEAVAATYRALGTANLSFGTSGNVSARTGDGMLITRSGISVDRVTAADIVAVGSDGTVAAGGKPSSEWFMHADIYAAYPAAQAVIHAHPDACTALACLGRPIPAFHYMIAGFGGDDVRCTAYVTFGTPELGRLAVDGLRDRTACLLGNHGMICHGASLETALATAIRLEALARQYLLACSSAGTPRLLDAEAMRVTRERYATYG